MASLQVCWLKLLSCTVMLSVCSSVHRFSEVVGPTSPDWLPFPPNFFSNNPDFHDWTCGWVGGGIPTAPPCPRHCLSVHSVGVRPSIYLPACSICHSVHNSSNCSHIYTHCQILTEPGYSTMTIGCWVLSHQMGSEIWGQNMLQYVSPPIDYIQSWNVFPMYCGRGAFRGFRNLGP